MPARRTNVFFELRSRVSYKFLLMKGFLMVIRRVYERLLILEVFMSSGDCSNLVC